MRASTRHGKYGRRTYNCWAGLKARCTNPTNAAYAHYGGRGITIADRWLDFAAFYADMGDCPPGHTIDRKDNGKGYGPENCRWATMRDQNRNKRSNHVLEYNGETKCLADWAEEFGINPNVLWKRLKRGWALSDALRMPVARP